MVRASFFSFHTLNGYRALIIGPSTVIAGQTDVYSVEMM